MLSFSRGQEVMHYIYVPTVYIFSEVVHTAHHQSARKPLVVETSPIIVAFIGKIDGLQSHKPVSDHQYI